MATYIPVAPPDPPGPPADAWDSVDPLGEALHFLRMTGVVYARSELSAPWAVDLPPMSDCVLFHVVTEGKVWLLDTGDEPVLLQPGEFTLIPHGEGHRIADDPESPAENLFDLPREWIAPHYEFLRYGGGGAPTNLLCGAVKFDHPAASDLVRMLPRVLRVRAWESPQGQWMESSLRLMADECTGRRPGGETIMTRLADILVIQTIRSWIEENPDAQTGWLGALQDESIGPAILNMQRDPSRSWTVEGLARSVAMSRSAFAARFKELVGETPVQYLTRWRMHTALGWLRASECTVTEAGQRLGYQSDAAFSRAFKRVVGYPPSRTRREASRE